MSSLYSIRGTRILSIHVLCAAMALAAGLAVSRARAAGPGAGRPGAAAETLTRVDNATDLPAKLPMRPLSEELGVALGEVPVSFLPALDMPSVLAEDAATAQSGDKRLRYGIGRDMWVRLEHGHWYDVAGGGALWAADIVAERALGLRVHLTDLNLPAGARLAVYGPESPVQRVWVFEDRGWSDDGTVWVPTVFGTRARVEAYFPNAGANRANIPSFTIDQIQHIYLDPVAAQPAPRVPASCEDVTCEAAWATVAKACAGIGTVNQNSLYCSGQMLNAQNNDLTPYWITANHCLSTQAAASSAEIYWLYQTPTCNGTPPSIASVPQSAPCTLLSTNSASDYTLLMVEGTVPRSQIAWAGWTSTAPANGTACAGIHHPQGSLKKISFGVKQNSFASCAVGGHVGIDWNSNSHGTEPGSSGSGVFRSDTQQFFGQLHCGPSTCETPSNDDYGNFATTYPNISSLLAAGSDDALEQNDGCATARPTTAGTYNSLIIKSTDEDWYAIAVGAGASLTATATFTHSNGDIDIQLYNACGGSVVASSTTTTNTETFTYNNTGAAATFYLRVYLAADTRNGYNMTLSTSCPVPGIPGGVAASDSTNCTAVTVSWNAISGATGYEVWRNTVNNSGTATQIGSPASSPYDDATAAAGTTYYYWIKATNACGASGFSAADTGVRANAPTSPTGVAASDQAFCDRVRVTWNAVSGATSYQVWRNAINDSATAGQIGTAAGSPYDDATVTPGVPYYYWVKTVSACGTSGFSIADAGATACSGLPGDMDCNGIVNGDDLPPFVDAVVTASTAASDVCPGDFSGNVVMDAADVPGMVAALLGI